MNYFSAICYQNFDKGTCWSAIPRFYFSVAHDNCFEFTYGGCRGNGNNFLSKEACTKTCKGKGPRATGKSTLLKTETIFFKAVIAAYISIFDLLFVVSMIDDPNSVSF